MSSSQSLSLECLPPSAPSFSVAYRYAQMPPTVMTAAGLSPDDDMVLLDATSNTPIFVCRAWPNRKIPINIVRIACDDSVLGVARVSGTDVRCARLAAHPLLAPAHVVHVVRRAGAGAAARGGPSLASLRQLLQGVVLPLSGLTLQLSGAPPLELINFTGILSFVDGDTAFREGSPQQRSISTSAAEHVNSGDISSSVSTSPAPPVPLVGGLEKQLAELEELCDAALKNAHQYATLGLRPPRGALLSGPPGTGKTLLASALAARINVPLVVVNGAELLSSTLGATERRLRDAWARAGGGILFLDEVDALAPSRDGDAEGGETDARVVAALLALMDGVGGSVEADATVGGRVFVLGATNRADALDVALRRPGRFDKEIALSVPTAAARVDILRVCLAQYPHDVPGDVASRLALENMHGFVGADIAAACREGAFAALRRASGSGSVPADVDSGGINDGMGALADGMQKVSLGSESFSRDIALVVGADDLRAGLKRVQPSALRAIAVDVAATPWDAIAGQEATKARLREAIEWPTLHAALFAHLGIRPPRGVLLYGPPGCSKTMMARAMATSGKANFIAVKGPELFSKYVGDSEKAVAEVFARARAAAPCVVFFDEFDALAAARDDEDGASVNVRVVAQLLVELDGVSSALSSAAGVIVVAATNRPDLIDPALLRPGRMDALLYVGLPDATAREHMATGLLALVPHDAHVTPAIIAEAMKGFSGAEVVGVLRDASLRAVHAAIGTGADGADAEPLLTWNHIKAALDSAPRQVTAEMLDFYAEWRGRK